MHDKNGIISLPCPRLNTWWAIIGRANQTSCHGPLSDTHSSLCMKHKTKIKIEKALIKNQIATQCLFQKSIISLLSFVIFSYLSVNYILHKPLRRQRTRRRVRDTSSSTQHVLSFEKKKKSYEITNQIVYFLYKLE